MEFVKEKRWFAIKVDGVWIMACGPLRLATQYKASDIIDMESGSYVKSRTQPRNCFASDEFEIELMVRGDDMGTGFSLSSPPNFN